MVMLPELNQDKSEAHLASTAQPSVPNGTSQISSQRFSEVELVQKMIDGVTKLITLEQKMHAKSGGAATKALAEAASKL